jgi:hypothetical protein
MKILTLPALGVLSLALAGCIGKNDPYDHDHADHHSSSSVITNASSSVVTNASSSVIITESSMALSSSSAATLPSSSSIAPSSSSIASSEMSSIASSSSVEMASSSISSAASSSIPAVNIEDLSFSAELKTDQSIETDSIANLGSALIGLIDKEAYEQFYLSLVAQGLDQAAINKAVSVLGPIGMAIGADFIKAFSGQALLTPPEGINLVSTVTPIGSRGNEYGYTVNQTIDDVAVVLKLALRFPKNSPTLNALVGRNGYNVYLDDLEFVVSELSLTTSDVVITLDTTNKTLLTTGNLDAQIELTPDGAGITKVTLNGESLALNVKGTVVNGIIGVTANGSGTIGVLNADLDMVSGSSKIDVTQPNVQVDMQGLDTSN